MNEPTDEVKARIELAKQAIAHAERARGRWTDVYVGDKLIGTMERREVTLFNAGFEAALGNEVDLDPIEPWPREKFIYTVR